MTSTITCAGCNHGYADTALFCPNCGRPKVREAATDALVGKLLGERFQVQALLGQGGSGTLYRAEHVTLRRKVAIKVLHAELSRDDLAVERFRREATTVADIDNEHIVEIHDFGRTPDGRLYLAMELLEGEGLDAILAREKQLSIERAADILIQVGEALMEAHAIGYVHRDLRPRNIYLTVRRGKANFVKLLDFGLAKLVETEKEAAPSTRLGMTFGDPRYMSPEQARGDRIDRRADIYQLGCVAYEMLTGAPPFTGNRVFEILTKQVTEAPSPLPTRRPGVPLWMEAAVAKMLAKDPDNRFATTSRMVEALRRGLDTGEVMEDAIARRRESVPPPSVSRVMQRMGIVDDPAPLPAPVSAPAASSSPAAAAAAMPAAAAAVAAAVPAAAAAVPPVVAIAPPASVDDLPTRRGTGTPKVGVPVVRAPADADADADPALRPVTGTIEPSPERARARSHDDNNISQVWYDDGDADGAGGSRTSRSLDNLYDDDVPPRGRRWGLILGGLGLLVAGGIALAMSLGGGGDKPADPAPTEPVAATSSLADAAPSMVLDTVDAGVAAPDDSTNAATKPTTGGTTTKPSSRPSRTGGGDSGGTIRTYGTPVTTGTASRPSGPSDSDFGVFGDAPNPANRRPGGSSPRPTPTPTVVTTPTPYDNPNDRPAGPSGVDGPENPYGNPTPTPTEAPTDKATFYANLGTQQLASGDTASAAANFKKALELDARNVAAITGMGEIALRQGLFGDAIAHLRKASRLAPRSARIFILLGEAYLNSGNNAAAADNFKRALQIDPDNARARDGYNEASSRVPPPSDE